MSECALCYRTTAWILCQGMILHGPSVGWRKAVSLMGLLGHICVWVQTGLQRDRRSVGIVCSVNLDYRIIHLPVLDSASSLCNLVYLDSSEQDGWAHIGK
jgi:hypothetical protein